jgi:hypothetical protein
VEGKRPGIFVGGWAFLSLETVVAAMTCPFSFLSFLLSSY